MFPAARQHCPGLFWTCPPVVPLLSPDGEQLVLLAEDKGREIKLDALEMQFYRLLLASPALQGHYASLGPKIRYGRSCRDLSAVLSADSIAAFAGIGSKATELSTG